MRWLGRSGDGENAHGNDDDMLSVEACPRASSSAHSERKKRSERP